ncbi:MAG: ECF-type sigma factor [Isosphaeraceae bacterium]
MSPPDEVTLWLEQMKRGDRDPVGPLFDRYFQRVVALAASRLKGRGALAGYDEDVALSAFKSLCLGAERGRFPWLGDRDALWRLLAVITVRKAVELHRRKRPDLGPEDAIQDALSHEPAPDEVAEFSDSVDTLLGRLGDPELRQIALWKVEGHSNAEIATRLGCVERTVERKLHQIRLVWEREVLS